MFVLGIAWRCLRRPNRSMLRLGFVPTRPLAESESALYVVYEIFAQNRLLLRYFGNDRNCFVNCFCKIVTRKRTIKNFVSFILVAIFEITDLLLLLRLQPTNENALLLQGNWNHSTVGENKECDLRTIVTAYYCKLQGESGARLFVLALLIETY